MLLGWFYGYMEDGETFFINTIGLVPAFRGRGIYSAFLRQLIAYLRALGYERLTTSHGPNNRAALIADLSSRHVALGSQHAPQVIDVYGDVGMVGAISYRAERLVVGLDNQLRPRNAP